jgi:hypothetical protein
MYVKLNNEARSRNHVGRQVDERTCVGVTVGVQGRIFGIARKLNSTTNKSKIICSKILSWHRKLNIYFPL